MSQYSISDLQQLSGIKAHTIRIWEQRYQALKPGRSEGNTRFYDDSQLRRLLNIVTVVETGVKVNEACSLPDKKLAEIIEEKLIQQSKLATPQEYFISQLIAAGMEFNESLFEKHFSACILRYGVHDTYTGVLQPMLNRVGLMWSRQSINPAQEHFISNLVRQKLYTAIDALPPAKEDSDSWLLFLPENEYHEIGLLYVNYYLKSIGKKVIYLGAAVPFESLQATLKAIETKNVYFFLIHMMPSDDAQELVQKIRLAAKKSRLFISGNSKLIENLKLPERTYVLADQQNLQEQAQKNV